MVEFRDPALAKEAPKAPVEEPKTTGKKRLKKRAAKSTPKKAKKPGRKKSITTARKETGHPVKHIEVKELEEKAKAELITTDDDTPTRGRPEKTIEPKDLSKIATMAGLGMKVPDIAAVFDMSKATFEKKCRENPSIYQALLKGRGEAKLGLTKKAYKEAMAGNTAVLIFLLKTQCGFSENDPHTQININMGDGTVKGEMSKEDKIKMLQDKLTYDDILLLIEKERKERNVTPDNVIEVTPQS